MHIFSLNSTVVTLEYNSMIFAIEKQLFPSTELLRAQLLAGEYSGFRQRL